MIAYSGGDQGGLLPGGPGRLGESEPLGELGDGWM